MDDKRYQLYKTIQADLGSVSYNMIQFKTKLENTTLDKETLIDGYNILLSTVNDLAILISKTAQLNFNK